MNDKTIVPTVAGKLRPIKDHILVTDMLFDHRFTQHGILILDDDGKDRGIRPRWARIHALGPEQTEFEVGQWVLVAHGRWTRGVKYLEDGADEEVMIRRVDVKDIMAVHESKPLDHEL